MVICDHLNRVRFFSNRHAGSAHDSKIWSESFCCGKLEGEFDPQKPLCLLGDEAFACSNVLLPPVRQVQLDRQTDPVLKAKMEGYNKSHKKARIGVEHCFGILKKIWPALLYELRPHNLENTQAIIGNVYKGLATRSN